MKDYLLLTTGPVPVSAEVTKVLSQPIINHRTEEFIATFNRVVDGFKYLLQTKHDLLILTASGTGGMDGIIANLFSPGDSVLVVENGKFSERWSQIAEKFGVQVNRLKIPWGSSITKTELWDEIDKHPSLKAVFLTHCETSTGALADLETIVPAIQDRTSALVIVDAISSAGVLPLKMDQWGIDVVVTASQKGIGLPPGLAMVALNNRAWQYVEQAQLPRYYFDFVTAHQAWLDGKGAAFTPAIQLIMAAEVVLQQVRDEGVENIWRQRKEIAANFRKKITDMGLSIFPQHPADSLTVITPSRPWEANEIAAILKDKHHIVISKGQGKLANKVLRIGHMVNVGEQELERFMDALKSILSS